MASENGWENELATMFQERENKKVMGNTVGTLIAISPLRISMANGDIQIYPDMLYISEKWWDIANKKHRFKTEDIGSSVLLSPADGGQTWFLSDKYYKAGD